MRCFINLKAFFKVYSREYKEIKDTVDIKKEMISLLDLQLLKKFNYRCTIIVIALSVILYFVIGTCVTNDCII